MEDANFVEAMAANADFSDATVTGANFSRAHRNSAKFVNAKLEGVTFDGKQAYQERTSQEQQGSLMNRYHVLV